MCSLSPPVLVWFRLDLRLADQPAMHAAVQTGRPLIPIYIWSPEGEGPWAPGSASRWWLHHSLASLHRRLDAVGSRLIIRQGPAAACLNALLDETGAQTVYWNLSYEPLVQARDAALRRDLSARGLTVETYNGRLLRDPADVKTKSGGPFQVFTPFYRHYQRLGEPPAPLPAPQSWPAPQRWPRSEPLAALDLLPHVPWDAGLSATWQPGEDHALRDLRRFVKIAPRYEAGRDRPDRMETSRLSPRLHFGEVSPRQVWWKLRQAARTSDAGGAEWDEPFLRQLVWREFGYNLLHHFPDTADACLRREFASFPWEDDRPGLRAWQRGQTGYPIVDAGMRQLWSTGWMHNRVRMLVASFLVKDLRIDWRAGARWFWDTLVDADLPNNTLGWQWVAGCGADAAPYFRIFNPVLQGTKVDPGGDYVRRWVPELARLDSKWIHRPWEAPAEVLTAAGIELGRTYPWPIVDHAAARQAALAAHARLRGSDR